MPRILLAPPDGIHTFDDAGLPGPVHQAGRAVKTLAPQRNAVWAVVDGSQLWHTADMDRWTGVGDIGNYRGTSIAATDGDVFVGSSEARLFRVAGQDLGPVASFDRVDGRGTWYTPWGGPPDTRSISEWDEAIYVNVHVGGILRTEDRGETWTPTIDIDSDVHQVTTAEGLVLAACAGGLAVSSDRGSTWMLRSDGLEAPYSRAVAVCGGAVLVSAANGPRGRRGARFPGGLHGGRRPGRPARGPPLG